MAVWWWETTYRVGPNLWVAPLVMSISSLLLFAATRWLDRNVVELAEHLPEILVADTPADAAIILTALLGAIATALALVFSTSILTFSLASSQLGPRLIRRFMKDPVTQVTLGAFLATLIFCVLTLSSVSDESTAVPRFSIAASVLLSLGCFGLLVFYVHRVASTIQAPNVVASVVDELSGVLDQLDTYLHEVPRELDLDLVAAAAADVRRDGHEVLAVRTGYVELIDHPRLLDAAEDVDGLVVLERRPGQFIVEGQTLAWVLPAAAATESLRKVVGEAVEIGASRTLDQDLEFAIAQVVEIALRALSPAINDTYTGLTCIDWLGSAMVQIGRHPPSTGGMCSDSGRLRLVMPALHFERVLKAAFDLIRQAGERSPAVLIRLLDSFGTLAVMVRDEHLDALRAHVALVRETAHAARLVSGDLADVDERCGRAIAAIDARG